MKVQWEIDQQLDAIDGDSQQQQIYLDIVNTCSFYVAYVQE